MLKIKYIVLCTILLSFLSCKSAQAPDESVALRSGGAEMANADAKNTVDIIELSSKALTEVLDDLDLNKLGLYFSENYVEDRVNTKVSLKQFIDFHTQMQKSQIERTIMLAIKDEIQVGIYSTVKINNSKFFNVDIFTVKNNQITERINIAEETLSERKIQIRTMSPDSAKRNSDVNIRSAGVIQHEQIVRAILTHPNNTSDKAQVARYFSDDFSQHDPSLPNFKDDFVDLITLGLFDYTIERILSQDNYVFAYALDKTKTYKIALIFKFNDKQQITRLWTVRAYI